MQNEKIIQDIVDFNKNTVKMSFEALGSFYDQTAKAADQLLGATPYVRKKARKLSASSSRRTKRFRPM